MEKITDFNDMWLPTLEFKVGRDPNNRFTWNSFENKFASKCLLPCNTALDWYKVVSSR